MQIRSVGLMMALVNTDWIFTSSRTRHVQGGGGGGMHFGGPFSKLFKSAQKSGPGHFHM